MDDPAGAAPAALPQPEDTPLDSVFAKAVQPFADGEALRASLPPDTPVVLLQKGEELPSRSRELDGGGTLQVPVLAALKESKLAEWHTAGLFEFEGLKNDEIAVLVLEKAGGQADLKVVTRGAQGALLVADLSGMLEALKALVDNPAFRAFPGGDFLVEALRTGIEAARTDLLAALARPDATGKSLAQQFRETARERERGSGNAKETADGRARKKADDKAATPQVGGEPHEDARPGAKRGRGPRSGANAP